MTLSEVLQVQLFVVQRENDPRPRIGFQVVISEGSLNGDLLAGQTYDNITYRLGSNAGGERMVVGMHWQLGSPEGSTAEDLRRLLEVEKLFGTYLVDKLADVIDTRTAPEQPVEVRVLDSHLDAHADIIRRLTLRPL